MENVKMNAMVGRFVREIRLRIDSGRALEFRIERQASHKALVSAWKGVSRETRCLSAWRGPGLYGLGGNQVDGATVDRIGGIQVQGSLEI